MLLPWPSRNFVSLHMELCEMPFDAKDSEKEVERFVSSYLKHDGVFVLRMIEMHNGVIFAAELLWRLWALFYGIETVFWEQNGSTYGEKHQRPKFQWVGRQIVDEIRRRHCLENVKETMKSYSEPGNSKETVVPPPPPLKSLDSVDGPSRFQKAVAGVRKVDVTMEMDDFMDSDEKKPLKNKTGV